MSDKWESYFAPIDDEVAAILVDLGIADSAPDPERPVLLWMWLTMQSPDENGFASEEEEEVLTQIEDSFIDAVELTTGGYLVGRVTTSGRREFYFYAKSGEGFDDTVAEAMEPFEDYEYEADVQDDAEWAQYFNVLYPGDEDAQQIFNRRVIDRLAESGDSLTTPRRVDHFANFPSEESRSEFIADAVAAGYEVVSQKRRDESDTEFPFSVGLQRDSAVDWETIEDITFELFDLARQHQGEYDGWGSEVVRDDTPE